MPLKVSSFGIARLQKAWNIQVVAAHTHDHVIADDHWCDRSSVVPIQITDLFVPAFGAVFAVQREQIAIGCLEKNGVFVHPDSAIAQMPPALRIPSELPELLAGARINGEYVVRDGEVEDAVDEQRSGFNYPTERSSGGAGSINPGQAEGLQVRGRNL
jgi:hypothetical protein